MTLTPTPPRKTKLEHIEPFERALDLESLVQIERQGTQAGALLLRRNKRVQFKFGFECPGLHSTLTQERLEQLSEQLEEGLNAFPPGETLTIECHCFRDTAPRQAQLDALIQNCPDRPLVALLYSEKQRTQALNDQGYRKPKRIVIYVTCTLQDGPSAPSDLIESLLGKLHNLALHLGGRQRDIQLEHLTNLLNAAQDRLNSHRQFLEARLGLSICPLQAQDLWHELVQRIERGRATPTLPQLLHYTDGGVQEIINRETDARSVLTLGAVPQAQRSWTQLGSEYVSALTFTEKPRGWKDRVSQLRHLWQVLSRDEVYDVIIVTQITRANSLLVSTAIRQVTQQSVNAQRTAIERHSTVDVVAQLQTRSSIEAQEKLYSGGASFHVATVILVHRPDLESLRQASHFLPHCFPPEVELRVEDEYSWKLWLDSLPCTLMPLLTQPFDRRHLYTNDEAVGFLPLLNTTGGGQRGVELMADEGGSPIYLDAFSQHLNLGVFATTRGGKSVLVSRLVVEGLAQGMPVLILDYPKPDGTSTFTDLTHFVEGAYLDVRQESSNLMDLPDVRFHNAQEQESRLTERQAFIATALQLMVEGRNQNQDGLLSRAIASAISLALSAFFADPQIQQRYQQAQAGGLGSDAWTDSPTLKDLLPYFSSHTLGLEEANLGQRMREALETITVQLRHWLSTPIGQCIGRPSTVRMDSPLQVIAFTHVGQEDEAAILALAAYSQILNRALAYPRSIVFLDEAPILFEFPALSNMIGRLFANGAKAGIRVFLSAQDPNTIAESEAGAKILQNMSTMLVGRLQASSISSFERYLELPRQLLERCAGEGFYPKKSQLYSQWLLISEGRITPVRFYPGYLLLAAVANNPEEQVARTQFLARHPDDPIRALVEFSQHYVTQLRRS